MYKIFAWLIPPLKQEVGKIPLWMDFQSEKLLLQPTHPGYCPSVKFERCVNERGFVNGIHNIGYTNCYP